MAADCSVCEKIWPCRFDFPPTPRRICRKIVNLRHFRIFIRTLRIIFDGRIATFYLNRICEILFGKATRLFPFLLACFRYFRFGNSDPLTSKLSPTNPLIRKSIFLDSFQLRLPSLPQQFFSQRILIIFRIQFFVVYQNSFGFHFFDHFISH